MGSVKEVITLPSPASMTPMAAQPLAGRPPTILDALACTSGCQTFSVAFMIMIVPCLQKEKKPNYTNDYHTTTNINYHYVLTSIPHHAKTLMMPSRPFTADGDTFLQLPCLTPH